MSVVLERARCGKSMSSIVDLKSFTNATGGAIMTYAGSDAFRIAAVYVASTDSPSVFSINDSDLPLGELAAYARNLATAGTRSKAPRAIPLRERLVNLKSVFGLSTKELAEVLNCARATIYLWLDETYQGQVNDDALKRLSSLEKLSQSWAGYRAGALGGSLHALSLEDEDGRSFFSMLKEPVIDSARCERALRAIANHCRRQIAVSQRLDERIAHGFGV